MGSSGGGGRIRRPRRETTIVRFQAKRLASGLYQHRATKLLVTLRNSSPS